MVPINTLVVAMQQIKSETVINKLDYRALVLWVLRLAIASVTHCAVKHHAFQQGKTELSLTRLHETSEKMQYAQHMYATLYGQDGEY